VRDFNSPIEDGLNVAQWRFDENPPESDNDAQAQGGFNRFARGGAPALPGKYRVKITVDGKSDETTLEYKVDPRENISMEVLVAKRDMLREIGLVSQDVSSWSSKVAGDIETVDKVLEALKGKRGQEYAALRDKSNQVKKELGELQTSIGGGGRGFFGGDSDGPTPLLTNVFTAMRAVSGSNDMPGRTQKMLMDRVNSQKVEVQKKMDEWYAANWDAYVNSVKAVSFSPIGNN